MKSNIAFGSLDGGLTRYSTMGNPFPGCGNSFPCAALNPQVLTYGKAAMWGYDASTYPMDAHYQNADIFQWNISVQRQVTKTLMVQAAYVGMRSNHLEIDSDASKNFISTAERQKYGSAGLAESVPNPFYPLFVGPNAMFNEPLSAYNSPTVTRINLLRPYPQFPGGFGGLPPFGGNATYNALQLSFEKRYSHGLTFTGNYTRSQLKDNSSTGYSNSWLGANAGAQDPNNYLRPEWGTSGSDTPNRFVVGLNYDLPFGRGRHFGNGMSRLMDIVVGGWQVTSLLTLQSGLPVYVTMAANRLADGGQRPNLTGNPRGDCSIMGVVNNTCNFFNVGGFSDPGDQVPGNAPRYDGRLRGNPINNIDMGIFKNVKLTEHMTVQVRGEFFNFTNTPQFAAPAASFGSTSFGTINMLANSPRQTQIGLRFLF
jgi:hypothetical protein